MPKITIFDIIIQCQLKHSAKGRDNTVHQLLLVYVNTKFWWWSVNRYSEWLCSCGWLRL